MALGGRPRPAADVPTGLPVVLFVATPAGLGGSNRSLMDVLARMEGRVHRVVAAPANGKFAELVRARGLAEEWVHLSRRPKHPIDRLHRLAGAARVARWALRNRARLRAIHANALTGLNLATPAARLVPEVPVVAWVHDGIATQWGARLGPWIRRMLPRLQLAAVSETARGVAVKHGLGSPESIGIIPNPIEPADIRASTPHQGGERLHVGYVGAATYWKGFDLLPDVVSATEPLPIVWRIYSNAVPNDRNRHVWERLKDVPETRVNVMGKLRDVTKVYGDLDIVVILSRGESFCRVAAEAMLNGIPVVGSDIPALRAVVGHEESGLLFPLGDIEGATDAIRRLVGDADLRSRMGSVGEARARQYEPGAVADALLSSYGLGES